MFNEPVGVGLIVATMLAGAVAVAVGVALVLRAKSKLPPQPTQPQQNSQNPQNDSPRKTNE